PRSPPPPRTGTRSRRQVREECEDVGREVEHHQVPGVLLAHESAGEECESCLHEEHQVGGIEGPGEVGGDAQVADGVRELGHQGCFAPCAWYSANAAFLSWY